MIGKDQMVRSFVITTKQSEEMENVDLWGGWLNDRHWCGNITRINSYHLKREPRLEEEF